MKSPIFDIPHNSVFCQRQSKLPQIVINKEARTAYLQYTENRKSNFVILPKRESQKQ